MSGRAPWFSGSFRLMQRPVLTSLERNGGGGARVAVAARGRRRRETDGGKSEEGPPPPCLFIREKVNSKMAGAKIEEAL